MAVDYVEIIKIGLPLLGGGAMGAIIKTYVDKRKNRIQPIKKLVEISNLFTPEKILDDYLTKLHYPVQHLFIILTTYISQKLRYLILAIRIMKNFHLGLQHQKMLRL